MDFVGVYNMRIAQTYPALTQVLVGGCVGCIVAFAGDRLGFSASVLVPIAGVVAIRVWRVVAKNHPEDRNGGHS